jgi:hypothetical protein
MCSRDVTKKCAVRAVLRDSKVVFASGVLQSRHREARAQKFLRAVRQKFRMAIAERVG